MMNLCEWCTSLLRNADGKIIHDTDCVLYSTHVQRSSMIPETHYCSLCRSNYTGTPQFHFISECVYDNGCPHCKMKHIDVWHVAHCGHAKNVQEEEKQEEHISLDKRAEASSIEIPHFSPYNVTRFGSSSRWSSKFSDPQWIMIDLEEIFEVKRVVLDWENAYAKSYEIQTSIDGTSWNIVYATDVGRSGAINITFSPTQARFVRMYGKKRATQWGYSLWSFKVYGHQDMDDKPMVERLKRNKWWNRELPKGEILIIDERRKP